MGPPLRLPQPGGCSAQLPLRLLPQGTAASHRAPTVGQESAVPVQEQRAGGGGGAGPRTEWEQTGSLRWGLRGGLRGRRQEREGFAKARQGSQRGPEGRENDSPRKTGRSRLGKVTDTTGPGRPLPHVFASPQTKGHVEAAESERVPARTSPHPTPARPSQRAMTLP